MAYEIFLDEEVDEATLSRGFRSNEPHSVGRVVLTRKMGTTPQGEQYTYGLIDVHFTEPLVITVGVGLIPAFEPVVPTILADNSGTKYHIGFALHRLIDGPA